MAERLPILVLAGSDPGAGRAAKGLDAGEMLTGYKGAYRLWGGRCMVAELIDRVRKSERFEDPILVAPRRIFEREVDCELVDVDGPLATTLNRVIEVLKSRFSKSLDPVALCTCDILPTPEDFRQLLHTCYEPAKQCMFWWELVESDPAELGAGAWKPSYSMRPEPGQPTKNLYPGHLVIVRPKSLRAWLVTHVLDMAYRYRNWNARTRHVRMVLHGLGRLLAHDVRSLLSLKAPVASVSVSYAGMRTYRKLRRGVLTLQEFERSVARTLLHREYQGAANGRPVVFSIARILSFAKDIDTQSELAEVAAQAG